MTRCAAALLLLGLLAACNTGDSVLEWDEETAAIVAAQEAAAEAEAAGESGEAVVVAEDGTLVAEAVAVPDPAALQVALALLAADGTLAEGTLQRDPGGEQANMVSVRWMDGNACSGGLVEQAANAEGAVAGTFALNCGDGTVWFGDYVDLAPGQGSWVMKSSGGVEARAVFGADVTPGVAPDAFEALWLARPARPGAFEAAGG